MDWAQEEARALVFEMGMVVPAEMISVDRLREVLRNAYAHRARLNHAIDRAEAALMEMDPAYRAIMEQLYGYKTPAQK